MSAFPDTPFSELLEADESTIADYIDWLWKRESKRGAGHASDRSKITYLTGSHLAPATIRRRVGTVRSFYRWCIRLRHRQDTLNPVRAGIRGRERGLVPVPLPPVIVAELNEQDEAGSGAMTKLEALPPPTLPSPAFHFNKKVPLHSAATATEGLHARLAYLEAQIAKKRGKADQRSASLQALLREQAELKALVERQKTDG